MAASNEFALAYAKNFWDIGNQIVILMFGLAFAVYYVLVQNNEVRRLVSKFNFRLVRLTLVSNVLLLAVLWYMNTQEIALAEMANQSPIMLHAIKVGLYIRAALLAGNTIIYIIVLRFVKNRIDPDTGSPIVQPA